jgi:NADH-quinone oxidoreductase subunit M
MSILYCFILIPVLTITGILFTNGGRSARVVAASGMLLQLIMAVVLLFMFFAQRHAGNTAEMLFLSDHSWFPALNIRFTTGVDGIAVSMILLTSIVVFAGIFASWEMEDLAREFFISLIILATGVFGFFISIDLFTNLQ